MYLLLVRINIYIHFSELQGKRSMGEATNSQNEIEILSMSQCRAQGSIRTAGKSLSIWYQLLNI